MTKILAIGDFHGQLSNKLLNKIKQESPDYILSPGDFCGNKQLAKLYFKYAYGKTEDEIPKHIKKRLDLLDKIAMRDGIKVIQKLKSLNIPIFAIRGNWDPTPFGHDLISKVDKKSVKKFEKLQDKNLNFVDFKTLDFVDFVLVGGVSSTAPINPKQYTVNKVEEQRDLSRSDAKKYLKELNKNWKIRQKDYEDAFRVAKKLNKEIIFLTHNTPYKTKLDLLKRGPQKWKHYGSFQEKLIIKEFKPELVLCGHIHENFGKDMINKSIIANSGSAMQNQYVILDTETMMVKFKTL